MKSRFSILLILLSLIICNNLYAVVSSSAGGAAIAVANRNNNQEFQTQRIEGKRYVLLAINMHSGNMLFWDKKGNKFKLIRIIYDTSINKEEPSSLWDSVYDSAESEILADVFGSLEEK